MSRSLDVSWPSERHDFAELPRRAPQRGLAVLAQPEERALTQANPHAARAPTDGEIWDLLLELAERAAHGHPVDSVSGVRLDARGRLESVPHDLGWLNRRASAARASELVDRIDLYLPLCVGAGARKFVLGHLGQSLDGQIATASGASRYVTGPENHRHMHRLRALSDAVLVGVSTLTFDDPKLTTRLVPGKNPARVILDPELRAPAQRQVFSDQKAPTLLVTSTSARGCEHSSLGAELLRVPLVDGVLSIEAIVADLERRGLCRLFVEGGGITVSHFLVAKALTRLHITVSPVFLGSGRPGIVLPPILDMQQALRPSARHYAFGQDVLFDFNFQKGHAPAQRVIKSV